MSKEEDIKLVKIQTCVLKVNIHCDGCKQKVKKLLQKIEGVYSSSIDAEQGKVMVSGNVDPSTLIKKLQKKGKHAELWPSKGGNNQLNKQFQGMQIKDGKPQKGGKDQKGQQQQQMKALKDMDLAQFKGMKLPSKDQKSGKFNLADDDDDDGSDDDFDDEEMDDDDFDFDPDELKAHLQMKAMNEIGMNNGQQLPPTDKKGSGGGNGKKGGGGDGHPQNQSMGGKNDAKNGNGGKKGGVNNGGGQNQGGSKDGGKKGGPQDNKNPGNGGGGGSDKTGTNGNGGGNNNAPVGAKKGGAGPGKADVGHGFQEMNLPAGAGNVGQMRNIPVGQMGNIPAVQGLPAMPVMNAGGYFQGAGPEIHPGNPYHQQYASAMMMQQRQNGMYARPPYPVMYMPQHPQAAEPYTNFFSDENTDGCTIM